MKKRSGPGSDPRGAAEGSEASTGRDRYDGVAEYLLAYALKPDPDRAGLRDRLRRGASLALVKLGRGLVEVGEAGRLAEAEAGGPDVEPTGIVAWRRYLLRC
jgi:hypothetical protein